uniref:Uncharacterized protein n=2 Tax=Cyprinus carpio TaxID=7962 RepID=A0A8C1JJX3_CYPCA
MLIFGAADVLSIVNCFNVIHNHDALGDTCCVSQTAVYQAPGVINIHRPLTLRTQVTTHHINTYLSESTLPVIHLE